MAQTSFRNRPRAGASVASTARQAEVEWEKGCDCRRKGHLSQAVVHLQAAVRLAPSHAQYRFVLAHVLAKSGLRDEALVQGRVAFDLDRTSMLACRVLAETLLKAYRSKEALQVLDALHEDTPRIAEWHLLRTEALMNLAHFGEAARAGAAALALAGQDDSLRCLALVRMGSSFQNVRAYAEAALCYRMLLDAHPESLTAAVHAVHASSCACDWPSLMDDFERLVRCVGLLRQQDGPVRQDVNPFGLITVTDDPEFQRWVSEVSFLQKSHGIQPLALKNADQGSSLHTPEGKIRIGFFGSDFHQHATMILIVEMMESLNQEKFEIFVYSGGPEDGSVLRERAKAAATQWCETGQMSSEEIACRIRQDGVAVLIEMKGYTLMNRLEVVAYRAAPLQISWLGYPGTTGAPCMDYVIGDPWVTPLDAQAGYTECIAQMPYCYQPNDSGRSVLALPGRAACGLPEAAFVFASFNMPYKIVPEMFEAWCRILLATPGSVLWLLARETETRERLAGAAAAHGVSRDRLIFAPMQRPEVHRARLGHADLILDCFPCSGHTTASDALWAGVPVLTLYGRSFASRVAASLLHTLDLPELVCSEINAYMQQAVHLAHDASALSALRQRLARARIESPLFDGRRYARDFERLLLRMIERHEAGLPPAPLAAELS